jgi:hypothetical protein
MQIDEAIEVWRSLKDYVHTKDRQAAADQFVSLMADLGIEDNDLWMLADTDHYLENAVRETLGSDPEEHLDDDEWDER